jgi:acyl-CoA dehydrogenase
MIEFEAPKPIAQQSIALTTVAENMMRPVSRYFDEHEHEIPWDISTCTWRCAPQAQARWPPKNAR